MIDPDVRPIVEAELKHGETLLWADRPARRPITGHGIFRGGIHIFAMIFICIWILGVLFGDAKNLTTKIVFLIYGLGFAALIVSMRKQPFKHLFGPAEEAYGLTNERAIIVSPYWRMEKRYITPDEMKNFYLSGNHEIGSIIFPQIKIPVTIYPWHQKYWDALDLWQRSDLSAFHNIRNPHELKDLIHETFFGKGIAP